MKRNTNCGVFEIGDCFVYNKTVFIVISQCEKFIFAKSVYFDSYLIYESNSVIDVIGKRVLPLFIGNSTYESFVCWRGLCGALGALPSYLGILPVQKYWCQDEIADCE